MAAVRGRSDRVVRMRGNEIAPIRAGQIPRITFSTGDAQALQRFAGDMLSLQNQFQDQLDDQAQAEGGMQGAADALSGNITMRDYSTIRGRAYNQAALETFVTTIDTQSIQRISELSRQYAADPAGLQKAIGAYTSGVSTQLQGMDPRAVAAYQRRMIVRSMPAVEQARDNRFRLTREQADISLIKNEVALKAEIDTISQGLFSDNPQVSSASATALHQLKNQIAGIYQATDPDGKPLFTPKEIAAAEQKFYERVMTSAAGAWFKGQPDKAAAYLKFTSGDFKVNLSAANPDVQIIDSAGGIRTRPLKKDVRDRLTQAVGALGPDIGVRLISKGQYSKAEVAALRAQGINARRTGSTRHDHGGAVDIRLTRNGQDVRPGDDKELYKQFFYAAGQAGFTGVGHYDWGVHVGGGPVAAWGPNTRSNTVDPEFKAAWLEGRKNPVDFKEMPNEIDFRKSLSEAAIGRIESDMREQIRFENSLADREEKQEEKVLKVSREAMDFEMTQRGLARPGDTDPATGQPLQPLTFEEVTSAVRSGALSPNAGKALIKMVTEDEAEETDPDIKKEALRMMHEGEDIRDFIYDNMSSLTPEDMSSLLSRNYTMHVVGEGKMSQEQQFWQNRLDDLLTPDNLMSMIDNQADQRKFNALSEFRTRINEGEAAEGVARDIAARAARDMSQITSTRLDSLARPRFSVQLDNGRIDPRESAKALQAAYDAGQMTEASFERQKALLKEWITLQNALEVQQRQQTEANK